MRHLNTVHPDFKDHFIQDPNLTTTKEHQFVYMTGETYQDKNYYNYTNNDDYPTDNDNHPTNNHSNMHNTINVTRIPE